MANSINDDDDGGLGRVLRTAEQVMCDLRGDLRRQSPPSSSPGGGGVVGGRMRMDLSRYTIDELRLVMIPMVNALEDLDAASALSLTPSIGSMGREGGGRGGEGVGRAGGETTMAVLDPARGLYVSPIHDLVIPPHRRGGDGGSGGGGSVVRYLHVNDVPHGYSAGIFVFPPHARMPLHDHPNMVVLTRVLYGELEVCSYDVVDEPVQTPPPPDDEDDVGGGDVRYRTDVDDDDDDDDGGGGKDVLSGKRHRPRSFLGDSLSRIREFVLNRVLSSFLSNDDGGDGDGGGDGCGGRSYSTRVLRARPNLNPMGAMRGYHRKMVGGNDDDGDDDDGRPTAAPTFVITAPNVTCLYPREGNCHAFVAGPCGAAVLDVLFPPYDDDGNDGGCTYYETKVAGDTEEEEEEEEDDDAAAANDINGSYERQKPLLRRPPLILLSPIDQPDDFDCLGGSYGRFGLRR